MGNLLVGIKQIFSSATSRTSATFASNDLVPICDNAGNTIYKITKSDLMEAVKGALPSLLSDQSTNGTEFPSLASGVLGKMTTANLASLLGGQYKTLDGSIPDTISDGIYACDSGASPNNSAGFLRQYTRAGSIVQIFYNVYNPKQFIRSKAASEWSSWVEVSTDIPTFYKDYASLTSLRLGIGKIEFVDMGLPSGRLWASKNLGADTITDYGAYFSWGNVQGQKPSGTTFSYNWGTANDGPYASTEGAALTGNIPAQQDAATFYLGGSCRMPTKDEFVELFNSSYTKYIDATGTEVSGTNKLITLHGVVGIYLKSKINGNTLFFPCAGDGYGSSLNYTGAYGHYWSSSRYSGADGYSLNFGSGGVYPQYNDNRFYGFSVRAVQ